MTITSPRHIAIIVTDTPIPGIYEKYGDFGDRSINLLESAECKTPTKKYQVCFEEKSDYTEALNDVFAELERNWNSGAIQAVLITGSRTDSFASHLPWVARLDKFLKEYVLDAGNTTIPTAGICFGHQIMAKMLGCKVGRNLPELGYELGITTVELNREIFEIERSPFLNLLVHENSNVFDHLNIVEFHQDIVYDLPPPGVCEALSTSFKGIGSTAKCAIQGIVTANGNVKILTFQGHPEFTTPETLDMLQSDLDQNIITKNQFEKSVYATKLLNNQGVIIGKSIVEFFKLNLV